MRKNLWLWQLAGLTFTAVFGSLLHFLYSWTEWIIFAPISAVNESTWEHMKIFFFPTLAFACIQGWYFSREYDGFWWVKLIGAIIGTLAIPILFYTWNGAFGKTPDWLNVIFFFLAAGITYGVEYLLFHIPNIVQSNNFIKSAALLYYIVQRATLDILHNVVGGVVLLEDI